MLKNKALAIVAKALAHTLDRFPLLDRAVAAALRDIERDRVCSIELTLQRADMVQVIAGENLRAGDMVAVKARPATVQTMIGSRCQCPMCRLPRLEIN